MKFEWDWQKNRANIAKHELDFADASRVFQLPLRVFLDERQDYGENRWIGIGMLEGRVLTLPRLKPMGFFKTCLKGIVKYPPRHF